MAGQHGVIQKPPINGRLVQIYLMILATVLTVLLSVMGYTFRTIVTDLKDCARDLKIIAEIVNNHTEILGRVDERQKSMEREDTKLHERISRLHKQGG